MHCAIGRSLDERLIFVAIVNELFIYPIGSSRFFVTFVVVVCLENMSSGTQQKKQSRVFTVYIKAVWVVDFSSGGYRISKVFA